RRRRGALRAGDRSIRGPLRGYIGTFRSLCRKADGVTGSPARSRKADQFVMLIVKGAWEGLTATIASAAGDAVGDLAGSSMGAEWVVSVARKDEGDESWKAAGELERDGERRAQRWRHCFGRRGKRPRPPPRARPQFVRGPR